MVQCHLHQQPVELDTRKMGKGLVLLVLLALLCSPEATYRLHTGPEHRSRRNSASAEAQIAQLSSS